jgi:hypothetical protein
MLLILDRCPDTVDKKNLSIRYFIVHKKNMSVNFLLDSMTKSREKRAKYTN